MSGKTGVKAMHLSTQLLERPLSVAQRRYPGYPCPVANASNKQLEVEFVSLQKSLWICAGIETLLAGYLNGVPFPLLIALLFIASIPTALLVKSSTELKGGLEVLGLLAICIALSAFVPLVLVFAYAVYVSVSWYSVNPAESL